MALRFRGIYPGWIILGGKTLIQIHFGVVAGDISPAQSAPFERFKVVIMLTAAQLT